RPAPFQDSMSGFTGGTTAKTGGVTPFFFDCLHLDGEDLVDMPATHRLAALDRAVPDQYRVARVHTGDPDRGTEFYEAAVDAGYEGVMVKSLDAPYQAGLRGGAWVKVKPAHTLDLVVLAAEWGSGRRSGWLSNLHLGARDGEGAGYVMLGKTFKGLTDDMLVWQTERFLKIESHRAGHVVFLRPEIVYEIAFDGVQRSTRYPGGLALRFARVKRYREDKSPQDADTIATVRDFHQERSV
ncbi:MAG: ATP-dependent DNA ligase, partial [Acidimicrobiia bacterium]